MVLALSEGDLGMATTPAPALRCVYKEERGRVDCNITCECYKDMSALAKTTMIRPLIYTRFA